MARIAITGGTGFVGIHTTRALAAAGHELRLLARGNRGGAVAALQAPDHLVEGCQGALTRHLLSHPPTHTLVPASDVGVEGRGREAGRQA